jgi:ASC-1-like (ASCH) protein
MKHHMRLVDFAFKAIKNKEKDIEIRLNDPKRQLIKIGDAIEFEHLDTHEAIECEVINRYEVDSIMDLIKMFGCERLGLDKDVAPNIMDNFYTKEEQEKYKVLGIEIRTK